MGLNKQGECLGSVELHLPEGNLRELGLPRTEVLPQAVGVRVRRAARAAAIRAAVAMRTAGSLVVRVALLREAISLPEGQSPLAAALLEERVQAAVRRAERLWVARRQQVAMQPPAA